MIEKIIEIDKSLLIFLNNLGSEQWDGFWLFITNQLHWIPLYLFVIFLIFKSFGTKKGIFFVITIILLIVISDQSVNFIKNYIERVRPCNDESLVNLIRAVYKPGGFSFVSGHATTSMFFSFFMILLLKKRYTSIKWILIFPLLFGFSRIYLGVHYPFDVLCGFITGIIFAILYIQIVKVVYQKLFTTSLT